MLWPINWKFHHYNGVVIYRFVLIAQSILDVTTCAIPLCKALTDGFISSMTPKTSDQVMGPQKLKISSLQWCCNISFCPHNSVNFRRNDMCHTSVVKLWTDGFISSMTPKTSDPVMGTLWPKNWKFHHYNNVAIYRFVLIARSILDSTTCAIPLCKALTDGFISSMTPKTSDQVMGTLWPQNWKFHHYNGVAIYDFVLITRSILDLTTCAIPLCKALTDGFISSMTPKTSGQVMGMLWPKTENLIITMVLQYIVLSS